MPRCFCLLDLLLGQVLPIKDEEKLLSNALNADKVYIHDILPVKMKYNLESLKHFGFKEDCSILWTTFYLFLRKKVKVLCKK